MDFDSYSVSLLLRRDDAPRLDERAADELQDAHMAFLASLQDAGPLLAAGPVRDDRYRGLSILRVNVDEALRLKREDPAVRAGLYELKVVPWLTPGGLIRFDESVRLPRSVAEITGR